MTVAAVLLFATPESSLSDAAGRTAARRMVESAWAGGAVPIVVVGHEVDGRLAAALAGSPATLVEPAPAEAGPVAQILKGIDAALDRVVETHAAIVWPGRFWWVDPETVTSLIESYGVDRADLVRPAFGGEPGWPVVVPIGRLDALRAFGPDAMPDEMLARLEASGVPVRVIDLGDPGSVHDRSVAIDALPEYEGPSSPPGGHVHEWGAPTGEMSEEVPLEGPGMRPYAQAEAESE